MKFSFSLPVLIFAILLSISFGLFRLSESPPIWYDEGIYTQVAMNYAQHGVWGLQVAPEIFTSLSNRVTVGYPALYPVAMAYRLFGIGVWEGRLAIVIFLVGVVLITYFLVRKLFDQKIASAAALLVALLPQLYGNGKNVLGEIPGVFFLLLSLLLINCGIIYQKKRYVFGILAGVSLGLCAATKPVFLLVVPAIVSALFLYRKKDFFSWRTIAVTVISAAVPLCGWFVIQFDAMTSVGSILQSYANPYDQTDLNQTAIQSIKRIISDLNMILVFLGVGFWAAIASFRLKNKEPVHFVETIALFFSFLILIQYFRMEGWSRYLFPALLLSIVWFPSNLFFLVEKIFKQDISDVLKVRVWAILVGVTSCFFFYQLLFASYVASYYHSSRTQRYSETLSQLISPNASVLVYDVPIAPLFLSDHPYFQILTPFSYNTIGMEYRELIVQGGVDFVIVNESVAAAMPELFLKYEAISRDYRQVIFKKI